MTQDSNTDCRSETGITVSLIDSIIAISRILATRDLSAPEIREALKDLARDKDARKIMEMEV